MSSGKGSDAPREYSEYTPTIQDPTAPRCILVGKRSAAAGDTDELIRHDFLSPQSRSQIVVV